MNDLIIRTSGAVVESNLPAFKAAALAEFAKINTVLVTDDDFAEAKEAIKRCKEVEQKITQAKADILNQSADISELVAALGEVFDKGRETRLFLEKKVKSEEETRKAEIINAGIEKVWVFIKKECGDNADLFEVKDKVFSDAVKGKKTITGMTTAVADVVDWNIESTQRLLVLFNSNLAKMEEIEKEYPSLFPDKKALCVKPAPELSAIIDARVATFKLHAEEKRQREEKAAELAKAEKAHQEETGKPKPEPMIHAEQVISTPTKELMPETPQVEAVEGKTTYLLSINLQCSKEDAIRIAEGINVFLNDDDAVASIKLTEA